MAKELTEEQIIKLLKAEEKRRLYRLSDKFLTTQKKYLKKRYKEVNANRNACKSLKKSDPLKYKELLNKVLDTPNV